MSCPSPHRDPPHPVHLAALQCVRRQREAQTQGHHCCLVSVVTSMCPRVTLPLTRRSHSQAFLFSGDLTNSDTTWLSACENTISRIELDCVEWWTGGRARSLHCPWDVNILSARPRGPWHCQVLQQLLSPTGLSHPWRRTCQEVLRCLASTPRCTSHGSPQSLSP